jgi:hypothetical protein
MQLSFQFDQQNVNKTLENETLYLNKQTLNCASKKYHFCREIKSLENANLQKRSIPSEFKNQS